MADIKELKEFFDGQPQAVIWLQPVFESNNEIPVDFRYVYSNEEGLKYLNFNDGVLPDITVKTSPTLDDYLREEIYKEMLHIYTTGERSETNIYNPTLNKYAKVLRSKIRGGILSVVQDRSEENRIIMQLENQRKELKEQAHLLVNLLHFSPAGISITKVIRDEHGEIIDGKNILANEMAAKFIGIPSEVILQKTVKEIDPSLFESPLFQMALNTLRTGETFTTEYYFQPEKRWLELSVARMDENSLINIFMDITSSKEAELRQLELMEELKRSNSSLEEFAYAASHDLKEPIRKINYFSERLRSQLQEKMNEQDNNLFDRLQAASQKMGTLIDDLLSFSQVSSIPHEKSQIDLNKIIHQVMEEFELEIQEKKAIIELEQLPIIEGYSQQIIQLFRNLVGNALKYQRPGIPPIIRINSHKSTGQRNITGEFSRSYYEIHVSDNGIGFEQKEAEKIFNVFHRLHGNAEYKGSGVGLAIARKVAQNHGGFIQAESRPREGALFKVFLPEA
jgi:signal transduction histidine kinase